MFNHTNRIISTKQDCSSCNDTHKHPIKEIGKETMKKWKTISQKDKERMVKIQFSILPTNTFSFPLLEDSGPWRACNE